MKIDPTNPLGPTYWGYYLRNYWIVPVITCLILAIAYVGYCSDGEEIDATFKWIAGFFTALNLFAISLSYLQYKNRI